MTSKKLQIAAIIILSLALVAVVAFAYVTSGFRYPISDIVNGENLPGHQNPKFSISKIVGDKDNYHVDVKGAEIFDVSITANRDVSFEFKVDGVWTSFPDATLWTEFFNVKIYDGYFTFNATKRDMKDILNEAYAGCEITDVSQLKDASYFDLTVTNVETRESITVPLYVVIVITDIDLNKGDEVI